MKKLATVVCTIILVSMMVSCGGASQTVNNDDSKETTKVEHTNNTQTSKLEKSEKNIQEPKRTEPIVMNSESKEMVWLELMTIDNMVDNNVNKKGGLCDDTMDYIKKSTILSKELSDKLMKTIIIGSVNGIDLYAIDAEKKLKAVLKDEIEKLKK